MYRHLLLPLSILLALACLAPVRADEAVSFRTQIAPILLENCRACHGAKKAEGSYRLDSYQRMLKEGDSGVGVTPGSLDESSLYQRIISEDKDVRMPKDGDPLPQQQIALVKRWIDQGAKFDAKDPAATLASIVPPPVHPDPPEVYPRAIPVTALAFGPDGKELFVGGYYEITVWNPDDGHLLRRIKNVGQRTFGLTFSPDGKTLAVACGAPGRLGEVRLFDPASGELKSVLVSASDVVYDVAYSAAGDKLAAAAADNTIYLHDVATGNRERTLESHSDWVYAVAFSPDGSKLASASRDKTAKVFDLKTGDLLATYPGHGQPVRGVAFHPDGKEVYTSAGDNKVHLWKIADGKKSADVSSFGHEVYKLTTAGEMLLAPSADKTVRQFETKTRKQVRQYSGHQDWVFTAALHAGTQRLASAGFDGQVLVFNSDDGKQVAAFFAAPGYQPSAE